MLVPTETSQFDKIFTLGELIIAMVCAATAMYLVMRKQRDRAFDRLEKDVDTLHQKAMDHAALLTELTNNTTRLTALVETHAAEIKLLRDSKHDMGNIVAEHSIDIRAIKERHERADQHEFIDKRRHPRP